jgi:glycosyltransferase involved in cell wall biosynthesis
VQALGFVDDLAAVYCQARCVVVPLLQGGGTPLKFIEALAYVLPVVATSRAASGLEVRDGEHCLIADGPEAFAEALIGALREGAPDLGRRARALTQERYSIQALSELLSPSY